jgi:nucleoside-diphosphate-sugar epimerase
MSRKEQSIRNVDELEEVLSRPTPGVVEAMAGLEGDIVILGVGGKMGPTLARMAKRASEQAGVSRRVIGVSRFSDARLVERLHSWGVETHACDLLDAKAHAQLPEAANIVYMAGMKFGSTGQQSLTWAMNSFLPGLIGQRYRESRIAVFSTGNVYGLYPISSGGARETDPLQPVGEYAMSCLGRERIFEHFSRVEKIKMSILRVFYAAELRYGVFLDLAQLVFAEKPVPLAMGYFSSMWQADASAMSLQSLCHASTPPLVLNIAGPELFSVRQVAEEFGARMNKPVRFEGVEAQDALICNTQKAVELFGYPHVGVSQMMSWITDWTMMGGASLGKPTHFENRAGNF